jgi:tetratricopeptide (TPR) repeat protein
MANNEDQNSRLASVVPAPAVPLFSWVKAELRAQPPLRLRAQLLLEGGTILSVLGKVSEAAKALVAAANADPELLPAIWTLVYAFSVRNSWNNIVRLREAEQAAAHTAHETSCSLVALGELQEDHLSQPDEALRSYEAALSANPADRTALLAMGQAAARAGDLERVANVMTRQIELTRDERRRASLCVEYGKLQESLFPEDPEQALEYYRGATHVERGKWTWLGELERFAERHLLASALVEAWEGRALVMAAFASIETAGQAQRFGAPAVRDPLQGASQAAAYYRLAGRLREEALGDGAGALEDLLAARDWAPGDRVVVADHIRLCERMFRWDEAALLLRDLAERQASSDELPLIYARMADNYSRSGDYARAAEHYRQTLALCGTSMVAIAGQQELFMLSAWWQELTWLCEKAAGAFETVAPELSANLLLRAADASRQYLSDPQRALLLLERAMTLTSQGHVMRREMLGLYRELNLWDEVVRLLSELAEAADEQVGKLGHLAQLAVVQQAQLDDAAGALATYGRICDQEPTAVWARLHQSEFQILLGHWEAAADTYRALAGLDLGDDYRAGFASAAGWAYFCRAEKLDKAVEAFRYALELRPGASLPLAGLEEVARRSQDHEILCAVLEERAAGANEPAVVERLFLAWGFAEEKAGHREAASEIYGALAERLPGLPSALWSQARCLRQLGRWRDLAAVFEQLASAIEAESDRANLLQELAELYLDRLGELGLAEEVLRRGDEVVPDRLDALWLLSIRVRANGGWEELDRLLHTILERAPESAVYVAEERLALAAGPGRNDSVALAICHVMLDNIPDHRTGLAWQAFLGARSGEAFRRAQAWQRLAVAQWGTDCGGEMAAHGHVICAAAGLEPDWQALPAEAALPVPFVLAATDYGDLPQPRRLEAYEARCALCAEPEIYHFHLLNLAEAQEEQMQFDRARETIKVVLSSEPESLPALMALKRVCRRLRRWDEFADLAEQLAQLHHDRVAAAECWADAGWACSTHDIDQERAERASRRALELDSGQSLAFQHIMKLLSEKDDREGQAALVEARVAAVDEPVQLVALLVLQASLSCELSQFEQAYRCLDTAVLIDSRNVAALRARAVLAAELRRWDVAATSFVALGQHTKGEERREAWWHGADIFARHLKKPDQAVELLQGLLRAEGADPETFRRILAVAQQTFDWEVVDWAAGQLARCTDDPSEKAEALRLQAHIQQQIHGDLEAARQAWERVLSAQPSDLQGIERLVSLVSDEERKDVLARLKAPVMSFLRSEPTSATGLRALLLLHRSEGSHDGAFVVLQVLDALGLASESEGQDLRRYQCQAPTEPQRPLSSQGVALLRHPDQTGPAQALQEAIAPILHKIFSGEISALSLGRALRSRGKNVLVERVRSLAEVFGCARMKICPVPDPAVSFVPVQAADGYLAVGPEVEPSFSGQAVFHLGRAAWHAQQGTAVWAHRTASQVRAFHDAVMKECDPSFSPTERRLGVDSLQREVHRYLARRLRRTVVDLVPSLSQAPEVQLEGWGRAVKASADRAGLLLVGSVHVALEAMLPGWREARQDKPETLIDRTRSHGAARELLLFALSEDFLRLRREVGLATAGW